MQKHIWVDELPIDTLFDIRKSSFLPKYIFCKKKEKKTSKASQKSKNKKPVSHNFIKTD